MQSLHAHLCLVIAMILQKSYALPTSADKTDSSLFSSNLGNSHACVWDLGERSADCNYQKLTDVPQNLFSNTRRLYLKDNQITILRNTSFQAYLELVELDLERNQIYSIEIGTFFPLVYMEELNLRGNPLFNVTGNMFQWMCELRHLILVQTHLSSFSIAIKNRAPKVQMDDMELSAHYPDNISTHSEDEFNVIDLTGNNITKITAEYIEIYSECIPISLDLFANPFERIDPDAIASLHVTAVHFGWNKLSFDMIRNITLGVSRSDVIKSLSLKLAVMTTVPHDLFDFLRNKSLSKLNLGQNYNLLLYPSVFAALTHVSTLDISECNLKTIDPQYFDGMDGLRELLADNNKISSFNPSATTWKINLHRMELGLKGCEEIITQYAFRGLQNLKTLFLRQENAKKYESSRFFIHISKLQELTLLTGLYRTDLTLNTPNLKEFSFRSLDQSVCRLNTTELFTVAQSIENVNIQASLHIREIKGYKQPSLFSDKYKLIFLDLSYNSFNNLPSAVFKNLFSLKKLNISENLIETIEPNAFIGLNSLETLDLKENKLFSFPGDILMHMKCLINLHLDFNTLNYLEKDLFISTPNLTNLTLSHNQFVGFNSSTFEPISSSLKSLDIMGNILVCNCELSWLMKYFGKSLVHGEKTMCSTTSDTLKHLQGKPIITFQYKKYCGLDVHLVLWISAAALALFALSMTAIIFYHYRWLLRYKLFLLKLAVLGYREIQDDRAKREFDYDINIMFLEGDKEWATNILRPGLDRRLQNYDRIAFGDDDLTLGMYFFDAIYEIVEKSYKTILLLSRAAVQDHIFMTKFRIAMNHVTDTETENLILVFLEDIPDQELPHLARLHLSGQGAYLRWEEDEEGQEYFWNKLTKHLNVNLKVNHLIPPE